MFNRRGQLMIEVLIAMGVASIILAAVVNLFIDIQKGGLLTNQRVRANNLVQEGIEAARSVRYSGWGSLTPSGGPTYHPVVNPATNQWELQGGTETGIDGIFNRSITVSPVYRIANPSSPNYMQIVSGSTPGAVEDFSTKQIIVTVSWDTPSHQEITQKTYLTRYLNNSLITQTTQSDFNAGTNNNTQVVATSPPPVDNGSVVLAQTSGPDTYYGNQFLVESTSNIGRLTSSNLRCSMRFTARASKTVNSLRIYISERSSPPTYRFGIQTDSGGNPSGTFLGYGNSAPAGTGWRAINLSTPVNLTAGQVYHLVVQYQSGSISNYRYINIQRSSPLNLLYLYNNLPDLSANTMWYNGSSWSVQNYQPIYFLVFSDSTYEGNPSYTFTTEDIYANRYAGEKFTITGGDKTVSQIGFYVRRNLFPLDNLSVVLEDVTGGSIIEDAVLASPLGVGTSYSWKTYTFATSHNLQNGRTYRIYLKSPLSAITGSYQILYTQNTNSAEYNAINYDGTNSVDSFSTNYGLSFTDYVNYDISGFRFTIPGTGGGYVPSGIFTSSVINAGGVVAFNTIDFDSSLPINTALNLQIATSNNPAGPWNFVGPDGTAGSFYTTTSSKIIHLNNTVGQYFRYQANLSTSNSSVTPALDAVYINYSP